MKRRRSAGAMAGRGGRLHSPKVKWDVDPEQRLGAVVEEVEVGDDHRDRDPPCRGQIAGLVAAVFLALAGVIPYLMRKWLKAATP
jgi:hypothetical protein